MPKQKYIATNTYTYGITHTHTKHDDSSAIKLKSMGYWDLFYKEFKKAHMKKNNELQEKAFP